LNDRIESMTSTLEIFAMIQYRIPFNGEMALRPVHLIGIDPEDRAKMPGFAEFLLDEENRDHPSFKVRGEALNRYMLNNPAMIVMNPIVHLHPNEPPPPEPPPEQEKDPDGIILGNAIASFRKKGTTAEEQVKDTYLLHRGDEVIVTTVKSAVSANGTKLAPTYDRFVVTDYFKSEMSEYDGNYVFVSKKKLQEMRCMENRVSSILIKLKNNADARDVKEHLQETFPNFMVQTWEDKQGPLLSAISVERGILNVLLFLIVGVAGFGILAIFTMIVVEKTRDIGILKALGASNGGVMKIFLGYGLLLGVVGAVLGTILGLAMTNNINGLEQTLGKLTGRDLFPRDVYYFDKIPTDIQFWAVVMVNVGAVGISVIASVLPALRAALLHPVRALRYE
jgi:lipoprotein-releasing system permease protein